MNLPEYHRDVDRAAGDASVPLPPDVAALLGSPPDARSMRVGTQQAFSFISVGESGHPHVLLLSLNQLRLSRRGSLLVSILGPRTRSNLSSNGRATLVAVTGDAAHYLKCTVVRAIEREGRGGYELRVDEHERDSAGVPLYPLGFQFSDELASHEHWDLDEAVVAFLDDA